MFLEVSLILIIRYKRSFAGKTQKDTSMLKEDFYEAKTIMIDFLLSFDRV